MTNYLWVCEILKGREWVPYVARKRKEDAELVMRNLEKRSAADCVLTRTETGFQCQELATGKVYKVKVK